MKDKITGALGTIIGTAISPLVRLWVWFQTTQQTPKEKKGKP